jgi:hypothetical protein
MLMATRSGTPALTKLRTAVRRKSWRSRPAAPARLQAVGAPPRARGQDASGGVRGRGGAADRASSGVVLRVKTWAPARLIRGRERGVNLVRVDARPEETPRAEDLAQADRAVVEEPAHGTATRAAGHLCDGLALVRNRWAKGVD